MSEDPAVRRAAEAMARRAYEQGGAAAVRDSARVREQAIKDLDRKRKEQK